MPLPGGGADKLGNRFELRWTVRQFIRLLTDEAEWIHIEPIGDAGDKIEFLLGRSDGRIEAHQAKRQQSGRGHWTIADLARVGVLEGLRKHTVDGDAAFVFVSTQAAKSLPELVERAKLASGDLAAFHMVLSGELRGELSQLQQGLGNVSDVQVLGALCNSEWQNQDESGLTATVLALLGAYLTGDPETAYEQLAGVAMDAVHRRITQHELWAELQRRGIGPSELSRDRSLAQRLQACTAELLASRAYGIGDLIVPRAEADALTDALLDARAAAVTVFLEGPAGVGKSGVVAQVLRQIAAAGWPLLPMRLDLLDPTQSPAQMGRQLLGRDKSPVALLAGSAAGRDCLLVLDQLDAVSVVSGRNPEVFNAVAAMVREAHAHPRLRVLLVCRSFDLENDSRLRELSRADKSGTRRIAVGLFDVEAVKNVLTHLQIDPARFDGRQLDLLRLPLHLALLAGVCNGQPGKALGFGTAKDLYDAYWLRKRTDLRPVLANPNAFETLLHGLCDAMNRRQALSVPRGDLPTGDADLDRLVSAHVLVRQGVRIAFFHEGFFDYVFARRFCELGESLLSWLRSAGEQDLFRRSQVRQILVYRRDEDFDAYVADLGACLGAADVRFHVKKLMVGVVGLVDDPHPEEWSILVAALEDNKTRLAESVREALWPSPAWLRFLRNQAVLSAWLSDPRADVANFAFNWLGRMVEAEPDLVADLLEQEAGRSPEQRERVLAVAARRDAAFRSERIEALFHRLAVAPGRDWESICAAYRALIEAHSFGRRPGIVTACRALGRWLGLFADHLEQIDSLADHRGGPAVIRVGDLQELAMGAPEALVEAVVAPLLRVLNAAADRDTAPPFSDRVWSGCFDGWHHSLTEGLLSHRSHKDGLLLALVTALKEIAESSPELYRASLARLRESDFRTAHCVLLRALAVEHANAGSIVVDYLVETWSRWGFWFDDHALWDCRLLLQSLGASIANPTRMGCRGGRSVLRTVRGMDGLMIKVSLESNLGIADVARLEPWILDYWEQWEPRGLADVSDGSTGRRRQAQWHRAELGTRQLTLLSALPSLKLSPSARRRRGELERKASSMGWKLEEPWGTRVIPVMAPVPNEATSRMTDVQWQSAIRTYSDDSVRERLPDRVLGGARELAGALEGCAKSDPARFARLMLALPEDAHEAYFGAITRGLTGGTLPLDLLAQVAERAHGRPGRPHGRWLPETIASHGSSQLSAGLLAMVAWYATEDPSPATEHWRGDNAGNKAGFGGAPRFQGINSVRGSATHAIATLIARDVAYWEHFAPCLERMVADPSIAVRTCVADACTEVLRYDRSAAVRLFLRLCDAEDALLAAHSIEKFIHYSAATDLEAMLPVLERMLESPQAAARRAAARQATLAALWDERARPLAEGALNGDGDMRQGAAEVLAQNALSAPELRYAQSNLIRLFADPDGDVRRAAGGWISLLEKAPDGALAPVVDGYIESPTFALTASEFFWSLKRSSHISPAIVLRAGQRFVAAVGADAANTGGTHASAAQTLSEMLLRAYRQAEDDPDLRRQCLDLFDSLLEVGGYGADEAIDALSR
jgi:hypothetical protein